MNEGMNEKKTNIYRQDVQEIHFLSMAESFTKLDWQNKQACID